MGTPYAWCAGGSRFRHGGRSLRLGASSLCLLQFIRATWCNLWRRAGVTSEHGNTNHLVCIRPGLLACLPRVCPDAASTQTPQLILMKLPYAATCAWRLPQRLQPVTLANLESYTHLHSPGLPPRTPSRNRMREVHGTFPHALPLDRALPRPHMMAQLEGIWFLMVRKSPMSLMYSFGWTCAAGRVGVGRQSRGTRGRPGGRGTVLADLCGVRSCVFAACCMVPWSLDGCNYDTQAGGAAVRMVVAVAPCWTRPGAAPRL